MGGGSGAAAPHFSPPDPRFRASFLTALREVHAEGRHLELPAARLADSAEFARYVEALRANAASPGAVTRTSPPSAARSQRHGPTASSRRPISGGPPATSTSAVFRSATG